MTLFSKKFELTDKYLNKIFDACNNMYFDNELIKIPVTVIENNEVNGYFKFDIDFENKILKVFGGLNKEKANEKLTLNCDESGFCFRIVSFLAAAYFNNCYLKVSECLAKRPLSCLIKLNGKRSTNAG